MTHCVVNAGRRSIVHSAGAALAVLAFLASGAAAASATIDVRHGGPVTGLFGIPSPGELLPLAADERYRFDFLLQGSSHSIRDSAGGEELLLDGETWRSALRLRARLGERLEVGVELPWIRHTGGRLDRLIDEWHALFGLPDGIRDERPRNTLRYAYLTDGGTALDYAESGGGVGDLRLSAGWLLSRDERATLSLDLAMELPTGDGADLTGNGATDYSLGLAWQRHALDGDGRWSAWLAAGVARFGESDIPAVVSRDWGAWAQAGLGWRITPGVELAAQLQAASAPVDSDLDSWGRGSVMLGLGAGFRLGRRYRLDVGFTEDIDVESAPDITFLVRLSRR